MYVNHTQEFKSWFWDKFEEWRKGTTNGPTAFAHYLGVRQQYVSNWLNGETKPQSKKLIDQLAKTFPDIYEVLGLVPLSGQIDLFCFVPEPLRTSLKSALTEITTTLTERSILPESPEGQRIAREIFDRYGFDVNSIEIKDDASSTRGNTL